MTYTGEQLRAGIVRALHHLWRGWHNGTARGVHDPRDADRITRLFEVNGFGWQVPDGYDNQPGAEYCGHTAAWGARKVGDYLEHNRCVPVRIDPDLASIVLPSTYRLWMPEKWQQAGYRRPDDIDPDDIAPGDIPVVGGGPYGKHITTARTTVADDGTFGTYEGNARGERGDGSHGKGIVRRTRHIDEVKQAIRLEPLHFHGLELLRGDDI